VRRASDLVIEVGFDGNELALLAPYTVAGQLLGFFTGVQMGLDSDRPKNLTIVRKSREFIMPCLLIPIV